MEEHYIIVLDGFDSPHCDAFIIAATARGDFWYATNLYFAAIEGESDNYFLATMHVVYKEVQF